MCRFWQIDDLDWRSRREADLLGKGVMESGLMRESGKSNLFVRNINGHSQCLHLRKKTNDDVLTIIIV